MRALRTVTPKTPSLRYIFSHFLSTQNPIPNPNPNPFPDEPTSAYYDDLINAAGRKRDFATVHRLLNNRYRDGCFNTNNTFKFISSNLSDLDELSQTLALLDRGFARKGAFDSLISRLSKSHRPDLALRVADAVVRDGHGANAITFHPILGAFTRKKEMEEAWRVIELMRENRIFPDLTAYNCLLTAYCFAGDLIPAADLLVTIAEEGFQPDTRTYDALVLGACRVGKLDGALMVLRRMEEDGVSPLYCTHAHVIGGMVKLGYYAQAVEFVLSYGGRDRGLDTENFGLLASRLIKSSRVDEANLVLEEMRKRGLPMGDQLRQFDQLHLHVKIE